MRFVPRRVLRRALGPFLLVVGLLVGLSSVATAQTGGPVIDILEIDGPIDRHVVRYVDGALATAAQEGAEVVVLQLDAPGGLGIDVEALVDRVVTSPVPVVAWVGPPGARASGAAALVAGRAHLLALSPGSTYGPVHAGDLADPPVGGAVTVILPAGVESLPAGVELPAGVALGEAVAVGETAAVRQGLVDLVAASLPDLLAELDGREVEVAGTVRELDVDPTAANVRFRNMGLLARILHTAASPGLAYLLIVGGAMAMFFELYQPGFGVAGVSGLIVFTLGAYGMWALPTNWFALAAVLAGMALLAMDLSLGRLGALTAGGSAAMAAGSWWLFPAAAGMRLSVWLIALAVVSALVYFVPVLTTVLRAQGNQARSSVEPLIGRLGVVRSMLNPEGHVFIDGALWRARAPEEAGRVKVGTPVRVTGLDDRLTLHVELAEADETQPA